MLIVFKYLLFRCYLLQVTGISPIKLPLNSDKKHVVFIHDAKIGPIPPFVRINSISMKTNWSSITNLLSLLQQFSCAYSTILNFDLKAKIHHHSSEIYCTPNQLLNCLSEKILPIFKECSPDFTFFLHSVSAQNIPSLPLIDSILKIPQVQTSSSVRFVIEGGINPNILQSLQMDGISEWMHRQYVDPSSKYYRTLQIQSHKNLLSVPSNSVEQLIAKLKSVSSFNLEFSTNY